MTLHLCWIQAGGCGGDTLSALCMADPDLPGLFDALDISLAYHPGLSRLTPAAYDATMHAFTSGETPLDILCVEGGIATGPDDTGRYAHRAGVPHRDLVIALAARARHVLALGTCACFGGIDKAASNATGLQHHGGIMGGALGASFRSRAGLPVINLPACPVHPSVLRDTLTRIAHGTPLDLGHMNTPADWYGLTVHQGCTRNEYHEYKIEEQDFGQPGCLFFHMGCKGPLAMNHCNRDLWNGRSSKTRAGVPCMGCTSPSYPDENPFYITDNIEGVPLALPAGVRRANYLAYKELAGAAAPQRLRNRRNRI